MCTGCSGRSVDMGTGGPTVKVVILGAGSTIGTFGNSLGVAGFVTRLYEIHGLTWRAKYPKLAQAVEDSGSWNLDQIWTYVDYRAKLKRSLCPDLHCGKALNPTNDKSDECTKADCKGLDYGPDGSGDIRRALLDCYSLDAECRTIADDAEFTLKSELKSLASGDAVISFNWDVVAERVASRWGAVQLSATRRPPLHANLVNLIKPHGSLSWTDTGIQGANGSGIVWCGESARPLLDCMKMNPNRQVSYPQPLVLGAVPYKDELLAGTQGNKDLYAIIADQWAAVVAAVERATNIVVIGYGFPPEDTYGRFLFRQGVKRRTPRVPPNIAYYTLDREQEKAAMALRDIFGVGADCRFLGPVKGPLPTSRAQ